MPNATCFLVAYVLVFLLELVRFGSASDASRRWTSRATVALLALALLTHSLYLVDRIGTSWAGGRFTAFRSWHDWGVLAAWFVALCSVWMSWKRSDKQIGLFVLPIVIGIVALAVTFPSDAPIAPSQSSASFWRLLHSAAMLIGTMLVVLGFAIALMYFVQTSRLKKIGSAANGLRLPSLEYLQSMGRQCILGSAGAVGFGVVTGAFMNLAQSGQIDWTNRGILFSTALFVWLSLAAMLQWISSRRGRGEWTAILSVLSFLIVVAALAVVMSTPHGHTSTGSGSELLLRWVA